VSGDSRGQSTYICGVAERPTLDLAAVIVSWQRAALSQALASAAARFRSPISGSRHSSDLEWIAAQPPKRQEGLRAFLDVGATDIAEILRVADEHVAGLEVLLRSDEILPVPMTTLGRSIHEACLYVCRSVDPDATPEQRVTRATAAALASAQGNRKTIEQLPNPPVEEVRRTNEAMTGMQAYIEKQGFTLTRGTNSNYVVNIKYGATVENLKINVTNVSRLFMPGVHFMWPVGSGATHSQTWFTAGLSGSRGSLAIMAVAPLLDIADLVVDYLFNYVGLDADQFHQAGHRRRRALLMRAESHDPKVATGSYADYAELRDRRLPPRDAPVTSAASDIG
jgi:hypothetical protein